MTKIQNIASITTGGKTLQTNLVEAEKLKITVQKTQNGFTAPIVVAQGENIHYEIKITNNGTLPVINVNFEDIISTLVAYVPNSFTVGGVITVPTIVGNTITYIIPTLAVGINVSVGFDVTVL